ncbi:hypothetical protein Tco_1008568 [Tanacetum coccineum]
MRRTIDQSIGGKLHDRNTKESWALLEDLALYDNESWNDPRDFAKPVKEITLPKDVLSTSDRRLIELENQSCMDDPEQAFVEYVSLRTDEAGGALPSDTVKNLKLSTSLVLSVRSYPIIDPQCSPHPSTLINAIKAHSKEANISQISLAQTRMGIET